MMWWKRRVGWQVHSWTYPVVWWARRKPRSRFRQWLWSLTDKVLWRRAMRYRRKLRRMSRDELRAHIASKYGRNHQTRKGRHGTHSQ